MPFEINRPLDAGLAGDINAYVAQADSVEPTTIIEADKDFKVHIKWHLEGDLTPFVCGYWCVSVFLESIGPGAELRLPDYPVELSLEPAPGRNEYVAWILVPAGTIKTEHCGIPYKLVSTVTYRTPRGRPGPMAGFVEGPVLQFYESDFS
jgi:hypothetical protein